MSVLGFVPAGGGGCVSKEEAPPPPQSDVNQHVDHAKNMAEDMALDTSCNTW